MNERVSVNAQMIATCPGVTSVPTASALVLLSVSRGFLRGGSWSPHHPLPPPHFPPPHHQQWQGKMPQCALLTLPGFSKIASQDFWGPPFQMPRVNPAS